MLVFYRSLFRFLTSVLLLERLFYQVIKRSLSLGKWFYLRGFLALPSVVFTFAHLILDQTWLFLHPETTTISELGTCVFSLLFDFVVSLWQERGVDDTDALPCIRDIHTSVTISESMTHSLADGTRYIYPCVLVNDHDDVVRRRLL